MRPLVLLWRAIALFFSPHAVHYVEPVWGAGGGYFRSCQVGCVAECPLRLRRERYRLLDDSPRARVHREGAS